ncbi:hypothetical protein [Absidia glauca]|uniref:Riboflavin kinase n=1 Tax=Absidia glauca TaxID=4829 RepID=A0A163JJ66_ABSGL|nr:hypothetical protein [Absidia glauca]
MTLTRYNYSDDDDQSLGKSINHPSFIKTHDSPTASYHSSSSPSLGFGIHHPSADHSHHSSVLGQGTGTSSVWSFHYSDFEQELLQDTSLPHSIRSKALSSPRSTPSVLEQTTAATDTRTSPPLANDSPPSPHLLDDYPSATQQRLEHSFFDHFDLHSSSHRSVPGSTSGISQRQMTDMMENKCLHMQESLSNRIQMLEDKLQKTHLDTDRSGRSRSSLSKEYSLTSDHEDEGSTRNGHQPQRSAMEATPAEAQRLLDLQQFVDRVDALIWNTPWMPEPISTTHVCERHRAWSEQMVHERQKAALNQSGQLPYSKERLDATMDRLMQWSESIQINPDRPLLVGPEAPIAPFPYKITGTVVKGYGRGSRELGIPTGMSEVHVIHEFPEDFYGVSIRVLVLGFIRPEQNYCSLGKLSRIGRMNAGDRLLTLLPFLAELIRDIKTDVQVAKHSLKRPAYEELQRDKMFD